MGLQNLKMQWVSPMGFETMAMECPHGGNSYPQFHLIISGIWIMTWSVMIVLMLSYLLYVLTFPHTDAFSNAGN